ncbi:MAG: adenosylcobinamide-GDP ribazoletransferase [Deltaproteobacteria bacterium]|nr:adenosylcobinamide-GDP ribazoletransferase [Candidatus Anaeroferrophillus wilburensis]MBN2889554.1 adenosylcobinamide-GDP ribazoletransferase [Deltaproteobacteria bacterium]
MFTSFHFALSFLTILPFPVQKTLTPREIGASLCCFPLVGLLLGVILAVVYLLLAPLLPKAVIAALLLPVQILLTGGFHLDGLADTADGLLSGRDCRDDILKIMKDSAIGTMGALALITVLLLKYAALSNLPGHTMVSCLILLPAYGRFAIVIMAHLSVYARPEGGLGQSITEQVTIRELWTAATITAVATLMVSGLSALLLMGAVGIYSWGASRYFHRRLGGVTGDLLGFVCETSEALALVGWLVLYG